MNDTTRKTRFKAIQTKSTQYLNGQCYSHRTGLNARVHQIKGMIEIIEQLPEHQELLEILQKHLQWLKEKQKNWPI